MIALVKKETPLYDEVVKQIEIKKQILNDVIKLTEKVWQIEIESIGSKWGFGRSNMTSPFSGCSRRSWILASKRLYSV